MDRVEKAFIKSEEYKRALDLFRRSDGAPEWGKGELGDFANEMFVEAEGGSVRASRIYELYEEWTSVNGIPPIGPRKMGMTLRTMLETKRLSDGIYYLGIKEKGFDRPVYKLFDKKTGETNGEYYDKDGLVKFTKEYWVYSNEGRELPERLKDLQKKDVKKELDDLGLRVETTADRFGFIK